MNTNWPRRRALAPQLMSYRIVQLGGELNHWLGHMRKFSACVEIAAAMTPPAAEGEEEGSAAAARRARPDSSSSSSDAAVARSEEQCEAAVLACRRPTHAIGRVLAFACIAYARIAVRTSECRSAVSHVCMQVNPTFCAVGTSVVLCRLG